MSGRGSRPLAGGGQVGERGAIARQAARDDASKTKWSRRDLLTGAAGAFGVVVTQLLNAASNRVDRVVGAWTARAGGRANGRTPPMCAVCEVRSATYDGRFCSSMCGWASVLGGKVREGRKRDVQIAVQGGRQVRRD
jgi:hypothetical protein